MFIKNYLLTILLLSFVCLISSQIETSTNEITDTTSEWTITSTVVVTTSIGTEASTESSATETSTLTSSTDNITISESSSATTVISSSTDETDNSSDDSESMSVSNTVITSTASSLLTSQVSSSTDDVSDSSETSESMSVSNTVITSAASGLSTSQISTSSGTTASTVTSAVSTGTVTIYTTATAGLMTNISATFRYIFTSDIALKIGLLNETDLDQVRRLVNNSFNLTDVSYTVLNATILVSGAKTSPIYNLLVDILFKSSHQNYTLTDIENAAKNVNINITLPGENGTQPDIFITGIPTRVSVTTPTYSPGGPSPGIPGQLGMGLGISFIGVLLIGEIIFLGRKYGFSNAPRREQYAMSSY